MKRRKGQCTVAAIFGPVMERTSTLESFPHAGRIVPQLQVENIREILHGNYRIIYRETDDSVQILTVHHSDRTPYEGRGWAESDTARRRFRGARLLDSSRFEAG